MQKIKYIKAPAQAIKPNPILPKRIIIHADPHLHKTSSVFMTIIFYVIKSLIFYCSTFRVYLSDLR